MVGGAATAGERGEHLADELAFGAGITIGSATVANTAPGSITTNPGWDGQATASIVSGQAIGATTAHVYRITVVATVPPGTAGPATDCTVAPGEGGSGFLNGATLTNNGQPQEAEACAPAPSVSIAKALVGSPTANGDGTSTVTYDVTVTNSGAAGTSYDLDDELRYGAGISVEDATITNSAPGSIATNPAWDGLAVTAVVADQTIGAGATHTYRVVVTAALTTTISTEAGDCTLTTNETGTGFLNSAVLTHGSTTVESVACGEPGSVSLTKEVIGEPVQGSDGTWTIRYRLVATNLGDLEARYDLDDELRFGGGIVVTGATVGNTGPGTISTNAGWDGIDDTAIVADQAIGGGATHTYEVTVTAEVPTGLSVDLQDCTLTSTESGTGFLNTASLTSNDVTVDAEACGPPTVVVTTTTTTTVPGSTPTTQPPGGYNPVGRLPRTGSEVAQLVGVGLSLLLAGWVLVAIRRRTAASRS